MHAEELKCIMTTTVTIRGVPNEVRDELAARAARSGRSLQEHLLAEMIELARRPDVGTLMAQVRSRKASSGSKLSAREILRYRDDERK